MNLSYFRLQCRPFPTTPDPQFYYAATPHEAAIDQLTRAVDDEEGLALLIGEPGVGKTLIAHQLLARLGSNVNAALITNCRFATRADLLRAILYDLNQPGQVRSEQELRHALTEHLLEQFAAGRRTVLVFDEAQDLTIDWLEELRLLGNLEVGRGKAVQVILIGQPSLNETLNRPELAVLSHRLAVRTYLDPLDLHESADYLIHQVRQAGGWIDRVMSTEAISVLAANAGGIPRLLNRFAFSALSLAEREQAPVVDVEVALEAMALLGVEADAVEESFPTRPTLAAPQEQESPGHISTMMSTVLGPKYSPPIKGPTGRTPHSAVDPAWCGPAAPGPSATAGFADN